MGRSLTAFKAALTDSAIFDVIVLYLLFMPYSLVHFSTPISFTKNHSQELSFSESTTANASGNICLFAFCALAINKVPPCWFVKKVPSVTIIGVQCCQPFIEAPTAKYRYLNLLSSSVTSDEHPQLPFL
ncbi:hypothetical protein CsatA_000994 [Cannabis sativa]